MASETPHPTPVKEAQVSAHSGEQPTPREHPAISPTEAALTSAVITAAVSIAIFALGHRFALSRDRESRSHAEKTEREARKRELLETLKRWELKFVVIMDHDNLARLYYEGGGIAEISAAAEKFRSDVPDKDRFDQFSLVPGMPPNIMDANGKHQRRETVCGAIRELINFVRNA